MTTISSNALAIAQPATRVLIWINALSGLTMSAALLYSFSIAGWPVRPLGAELVQAHPWVGHGLRAIVLLGIVGVAIQHGILQRLHTIVATVRDSDPFILANAQHLEAIAWRLMSLEGLRLLIGSIAALTWEPGRIARFSITAWLAILLLFVLAGVFAHGARMRSDLEGTV